VKRDHLLVVEDRASLRELFERALREEGYEITAVDSAEAAIGALGRHPYALVLTDLKLPGLSGLDVVRAARDRRPAVPVIVMTAYGTVEAAVEAMRRGALDFVEKPIELDDLARRLRAALGANPAAADAVFEAPDGTRIIGRHPRLKAALHLLERVAPSETTVLLLGESGTGKELFARSLHALSGRRGPFVAVNCAAIPEALLENELFGHERGAFTGADRRQEGRFERARGGTLFLDEIGELPLAVQAKVLRVLEDRVVERIGGGKPERVDVRLVTATNRELQGLADAGGFRRDLLYRLDVFSIELPPLRERGDDVGLLARELLRGLAAKHGRRPVEIDDEALAGLAARPWPGNVRELSNLLERALILAVGERLRAEDLVAGAGALARSTDGGAAAEARAVGDAPDAEDARQREQLRRVLREVDGDRELAAARLGWSPRTLRRRIKEFGLEGYPRYVAEDGGSGD
jgi:DNA-binding NtrC family response regulator